MKREKSGGFYYGSWESRSRYFWFFIFCAAAPEMEHLHSCAQFRAQYLFDKKENIHESFTCSCSSNTVRTGPDRM
jgi:hypothetical protein